ncbi:hypothetical protein H4R24_004473 [Coemansia sp. RSA 988]|nr:hypothetical protein H4R24_004473 [Coemansia sp. RSA 988]
MFFSSKDKEYSTSGKVVLLTGALGAIGRRLSTRLIDGGAQVALVDICEESEGTSFCDELNGGTARHVAAYLKADLRDIKEIERMIQWADEQFGQVDVLVNNAGIASPNMLYDGETPERILMMLQVNLLAPIEAMRQFAQYVREGEGRQGVVINMASMGGVMPNRGGEVYGAAKAALIHITRASASLAPMIRVAAVAPYYVNTPMVQNNPKLKNNSTVYPSLMLSVDQVCDATIRCIRDTSAAGKIFALIGTWTYAPMWLFDFAALQIKILAGWSLLVLTIYRLFGIRKD